MTTVNFKRPELTDRNLIDSYFKKYPSRSCDRTFANVYLWARFYEVEFAQYNNVLLFRDNSAGYGYAFPAGEDEDVKAAIEDIMKWEKEKGVPFCLYGVTKENFAKLETWFPGKFDITYQLFPVKSFTVSGIMSINLKHFTAITGVMNRLQRIIWKSVSRWH